MCTLFDCAVINFPKEALHGHHVLAYSIQIVVWMKSMLLTHKERHFDLPSPPARGHGAVLLVFWAMSFVVENLSVVSFNSKYWWFQLTHFQDQVKLGIFLVEYLLKCAMFFIGLRAPGLPTWEQRYQFAYGRLPDLEASNQNEQVIDDDNSN